MSDPIDDVRDAMPAEIRARLRAAVPAEVREVCEVLTAAGHQAVSVGGAVRAWLPRVVSKAPRRLESAPR